MSLNKNKWGDWAKAPEPIALSQCVRTEETEVLVIGAGMAGMFCAYSSAECGKKVTVLEKTGSYNARGFNIGVSGSSYMEKMGLEYDPDEIQREWLKRCGNRCDERIVHLFLQKSPEAMNWLLEILSRPEYGVRTELNACTYLGETYRETYGTHIFLDGPISRQGKFGGMNDVIEPLYCEMQKMDNVSFLFKTPMVQLIYEDGRVKGAIAKNSDGDYIAVLAKDGVVLCTGDIGGNEEMCEDLAPWVLKCAQNLCWHNGASNGDGHMAAVWLGAQLDEGPFPMIMHPQANRHNSACFLFVTKDGKRFMNEDSYLQGRSIGIIKTGEKFVWSIFDSDWPTKLPATLPYGGGLYWGQTYAYGKGAWSEKMEQDVFDWGLRTGVTVMADTPEELADKMGVDREGFTETLKSYNEMCRNGKDTEFGKRKELLMPLDKPPYIARKIGPAVLAVVGGLKVDTSMRVIGEDNSPIPGLYALGNTAGGRYAVDYPMVIPGNSIGFALTFGYLLGRQFSGK